MPIAPFPVWLNGELLAPAEAQVSVFDHGLTTGDGVFEVVLIHRGSPFALARHLARLAHSAAGLGLVAPSEAELRAACEAVTTASGLTDGRLRATVTGGTGPLGSDRWESATTVVVAASALELSPAPAAVATVPWPRNERGALAGLKTTSYAENVVALAHARSVAASEAIFANLAGQLCEGTGSNVFLGAAGRLVTPPLASGCLAGVTRALVIEGLLAAGIVEVAEEDLPVGRLEDAEEAFLASTTRGVQPISTVDGRGLAHCPGPLTVAAGTAYSAILEAGGDP
ncbi:MAG: aminotransferase class IV [Acidimicrobiales bacterium]